MNIFLDTNILLNFYHYSKDDLEQLKKLVVVIEEGEVVLHLTDQVIHEYRRNREAKFADAIKHFREEKLTGKFPQICVNYNEEYGKLKQAIDDYKTAKSALERKVLADFASHSLIADKLIQSLIRRAKTIHDSNEILSKARLRHMRGNPPGKNDSLGDAINWECLLQAIEDGEDLHLISNDSDFQSKLNEEALLPYLQYEWSMQKPSSSIFFYPTLTLFFSTHFPQIKLATELKKQLLVQALTRSNSFKRTRQILRKLDLESGFTHDQIREIAKAVTTNGQITRMSEDEDIKQSVKRLLEDNLELLELKYVHAYYQLYGDFSPGNGFQIDYEDVGDLIGLVEEPPNLVEEWIDPGDYPDELPF